MRISDWSSDVCSSDLQGRGVFAGLPAPLTATRYHSLTIDPASFPHEHLEVTATAEDGVIMGLQHRTLPIYGVQFHPDRKSVVSGKSVSVRVDLGGRRIITTKRKRQTNNRRMYN